MNIDFEQLGKRIAQRRHELGLKQCILAEKSGISNISFKHREWSFDSEFRNFLQYLHSIISYSGLSSSGDYTR